LGEEEKERLGDGENGRNGRVKSKIGLKAKPVKYEFKREGFKGIQKEGGRY
jgi:hypothetical protein